MKTAAKILGIISIVSVLITVISLFVYVGLFDAIMEDAINDALQSGATSEDISVLRATMDLWHGLMNTAIVIECMGIAVLILAVVLVFTGKTPGTQIAAGVLLILFGGIIGIIGGIFAIVTREETAL